MEETYFWSIYPRRSKPAVSKDNIVDDDGGCGNPAECLSLVVKVCYRDEDYKTDGTA